MEMLRCHMHWLLSCYLLLPWVLECVTSDELPRFIVEPESQVVKKNAEVILSCQVAPPSAEIRWKYDDQFIDSNTDDHLQIRDDNSLHISAFKAKRHAGTYICVGSTPQGAIISNPAKLHRARLGHFTDGGRSRDIEVVVVNATEGNTAVIPCEIPKGEPTPVAIFEINSTTIDKSTARYKLHPSGNLHIGQVRQSDQGLYSCIVKNTVSGKKKDSTKQIQLKIRTALDNVAPYFILPPPDDTDVILGGTLTLECAIGGAPVPRVTWDKYGGQLPEGRFRQEFGTLIIENVQIQDIGTYICRGENGEGPEVTSIAMVDVLVPPEITIPPNNKVVTVGDAATFRCEAYGIPRVHTKWVHDGEPVQDGEQNIRIEETSITITSAEMQHSGIWQCLGSNKYGSAYAFAMLTVHPSNTTNVPPPGGAGGQDRPSTSTDGVDEENVDSVESDAILPPTKPQILQVSENSVLLKWSAPLNVRMPVRFFKVQYKEEGKWKTNTVLLNPNTRMFNLQGLQTGIPYRFRIAAIYNNDELLYSPNTERFRLREAPKVPDEGPDLQGIQPEDGPEPASVDRSRGNSRHKSVTMCTTQQHPPTTPSSRRENDGQRGREGRRNGGGNRKKNGGNGGDSQAVKVPPSRPEVSQLSDSSVMLKWTVPENDGLRVTLFRVQYKQLGRGGNKGRWRTIDEDIPDNQMVYELRGLSSGHSYRFRIAAVYSNNDNAVGATSQRFSLNAGPTLHPKAPEVGPVIVQVKPSAYAMEIEWQYAHHIGEGPIDGFWIHYKPYNAPDSQNVKVTVPPVETKYTIVGLSPDTQYSIKMQCFNLVGASDFSNKVAKKTLAPDGSSPMFTPFPTRADFIIPITKHSGNVPLSDIGDGYDRDNHDNNGGAVAANNNQKSNELLYMVLGIVLGVMMLLLVIFMVMCAWKQRQQRRMMAAALDANARYKFQDPSQRIHNDSMRAKHGNGFLLNGLNGKTPNGHVSNGHAGNGHIPNGNGKMNINVNPLTQLEPLRNSDNEEEALSDNESNPDDPYTTQSTLPHRPLQTFGYPNDSNYNTLERNQYPIYHDNHTEMMNSNIPQSQDNVPSDPPDYNAIRLHNNYVHRSHDHISGVRGQTPRSHDQGTTSEYSYPAQGSAKHKRRRKRQSREQQSSFTGTQMKDQATNTDLSSNEGTLDSSFTHPSLEGHYQDRTQSTPIPHSDYRQSPDMYSVE